MSSGEVARGRNGPEGDPAVGAGRGPQSGGGESRQRPQSAGRETGHPRTAQQAPGFWVQKLANCLELPPDGAELPPVGAELPPVGA